MASKKAIIYYAVGILIAVEFLTRECHSVILILSWKNCDGDGDGAGGLYLI